MKALTLVLALLTVGDLALDGGAGVRAVVHAGRMFAQDFADDLHGSLFAS